MSAQVTLIHTVFSSLPIFLRTRFLLLTGLSHWRKTTNIFVLEFWFP